MGLIPEVTIGEGGERLKAKAITIVIVILFLAALPIIAIPAKAEEIESIIKGTISGDITHTPAVRITQGYEWRKVYITADSKISDARFFYFYQPILALQIDGKNVIILSQQLVTYKDVRAYQVKIKILQGFLIKGQHYFVARFDPEYNDLMTHTPRGTAIDVNGDGKSSVLYSADGITWSEDLGVDLIYEICGITTLRIIPAS